MVKWWKKRFESLARNRAAFLKFWLRSTRVFWDCNSLFYFPPFSTFASPFSGMQSKKRCSSSSSSSSNLMHQRTLSSDCMYEAVTWLRTIKRAPPLHSGCTAWGGQIFYCQPRPFLPLSPFPWGRRGYLLSSCVYYLDLRSTCMLSNAHHKKG